MNVQYQPENTLPDFHFSELSHGLRERVHDLGWDVPTPVQAKAIPYLLEGRDMIVQARTGSGKTAAYLLPILETVRMENAWCQALILVPTRELARQVNAVLKDLIGDEKIKTALLYGGVGYGEQVQALKAGAQIIVGTPGRVLDHVYKGTLVMQRLSTLVLDEADEMLSMGFYPAMKKLRMQLNKDRSTYLFSATIPYHVERVAYEFLSNPDRLSLSKGTMSVTELDHVYYLVPALHKDRMLIRLIEMLNPDSAIIFCNTKRAVEYLVTVLKNYGHDALHLTGDLAQGKRERTMARLREGSLRFLIATDVAARGIDISDLSHVFLYDIPEQTEVYVHRSGRTARAGKTGVAVTLCEEFEEAKLLGIARQYKFEIEKLLLPTEEEVSARVSERLLVQMETQLNGLSLMERERMERFLPLAQSLSEIEDTSTIVALLLDQAYTRGLHEPLFLEAGKEHSAKTPPDKNGVAKGARSGKKRLH